MSRSEPADPADERAAADVDATEPRPRFGGRTVLASMLGVIGLIFVTLILPIVYRARTTQRVPVDTYEVVAEYPHDPEAFTQGLLFADLGGDIGPAFYESTGIKSRSTLRRTDIESGRILLRRDLPDRVFGEGLTLIGRKLYQLTWKGGYGYIYDAATFQQIGTFPLPMDERTGRPMEGWGLATDGESLIISDGSDKIRYVDPQTFELQRMIRVRDGERLILRINELEYTQQEIWANVWKTDSLVRINPKNGKVRGYVDLRGLKPDDIKYTRADMLSGKAAEGVLNGIAFDRRRNRIFVTGKLWPKIFEIRVVPRR